MTNNTTEILSRQIAIVKQIKNTASCLSENWQIEIYKQVNKWLISQKISDERNKLRR